ncbi:DUF4158 domain-containing protein [Nonomuraea mangrovi]|uniref:DUF4158 domain-containing protein n=1 Tax=Nonomuraea mangrovi TaxID=2316207 RepID=A0ABW4T9M4_9ACTN
MVTSVERTAYRVFPRLGMTRELYLFYSPSAEEMARAREKTDTDEHLRAPTLALKILQRLGHFAKSREVPPVVVEHVRRCLELGEDVMRSRLGAEDRARIAAQVAPAQGLTW